MTPGRGRGGFTLIEVLIGLTLLALLVSVIQGVYSGVTRSRDHIRQRTERVHEVALALHRIADELGSAFARQAGSSDASPGFSLDPDAHKDSRLEFTASLPETLQEEPSKSTGPAGFVRLGYSVEAADDGTLQLVRRDSRLMGEDFEEEGKGDVVVRRVSRFRVQCSMDAKKWSDSWNSAEQDDHPLPRVVTVELDWKEGEKEPERSLQTSTLLYGVPEPRP